MRLLRASFALLVLCAGGRALADPACGDTVTSNVSLSADIVCPTGFTNWALRIGAPNITIEGNGKRIVAPTGYGVLGQNMNGVTVRNLDVSGNTNVDGVSITGDDVTLSGITATGRNYGVTVSGRNPTVRDCRITGAGYAVSVAGLGATIVNNDLQRNSNGVYLNNYSGALTFSGNNVTGSSIGLRLGTVTGTTFDNAVGANIFSGNGTGIYGDGASNVVLRNFELSADGSLTPDRSGDGINIRGNNLLVESVTARRRNYGTYFSGQGATIRQSRFTEGIYGVRLDSGSLATVADNNLSANSLGLYLITYQGALVFEANDLRQCTGAINVSGVNGLTIDNAIARPNLYGGHTGYVLSGTGTSLVIKNLTVAGTPLVSATNVVTLRGSGVSLGGSGHLLENVNFTQWSYGAYLYGDQYEVRGSSLTGNDYALRMDGRNATARNNVLTGCGRAVWLYYYQGPVTLEGNDLRQSTYGVYFDAGSGTTLDNAQASPNLFGTNIGAAVAGSGTNLTVKNHDLTGDGRGYGVTLSGSGMVVDNVIADRRDIGFYLPGASHRVSGSRATGCNAGIRFDGSDHTARDNVLTSNTRALYLVNYQGTATLEANDLRQSGYAISLSGAIGITLDNGGARPNLVGQNATAGISGSGSGITVRNWNVSHTGTGNGVDLSGAGHTVELVTAAGRSTGLNLSGAGMTARNNTLRANVTGLSLQSGLGSSATNNLLADNTSNAFVLSSYVGALVFTGNDLRGSNIALNLTTVRDTVFDNQKDGNLFGRNNNYGVYGTDCSNVTVRNVELSATGGTGLYLTGGGNTAEKLAATGRTVGLYLYGNSITVKDCDAHGNGTGLRVSNGRDAKVTGNTLSQSTAIAFQLDAYVGPLVFTGNDLRQAPTGVNLSSVRDTVFDNTSGAANLLGTNTTYGFFGSGQSLTIRGFDLSGSGGGEGIDLTGPAHLLEGVTAHGRNYGVLLTGLEPTVRGCDFSGNTYALRLDGSADATVSNTLLTSAVNYGLWLRNYLGSITLSGNDFRGSASAIILENAQDLTVDNAVAGTTPNFFGNNRTYSVQGTGTAVTVRNVDLPGTGVGDSVNLTGNFNTVENVLARDRDHGVFLTGRHSLVLRSLVRSNKTGIRMNGTEGAVHDSRICWNTTVGLRNDLATAPIDATANFWGTPTGPSVSANPGGLGDTITGPATFAPFVSDSVGCESELEVRAFELLVPSTVPAGVAQTVTVRALRADGSVNTAYAGTMHFTSSEPAATLPADAPLVAGVRTFSLTLRTGGAFTVTVNDVTTPRIYTRKGVTVIAGSPSVFTLVAGQGQSGTVGTALPIPLRVRVTDSFSNPVPDLAINFAASGDGRLSNAAPRTDAAGYASTTAVLPTLAGAATFAASVAGLTGSPLTFSATAAPGAPTLFILSGVPAQAVAGAALTVDVTAKDAFGNTVTAFTGPVRVVSDDAQAQLPAPFSLTAGAGRFTASLRTAGARYLAVANDGLPAFGSQRSLVITPAAAARLVRVSGDAQLVTAGQAAADPLVIAVTDDFGNGVAGATVTFAPATSTSAGVNPSTAVSDAQGRAQTLATAGPEATPLEFTASAVSLAGSPVSFRLVVRAGPAGGLRYISGGNQQGTAGAALSAPLVVLSTDAFGNRVPNAAVSFRALTGGSLAPATLQSDGSALASALATLGGSAGPQVFEAFAAYTTTTVRFELTAVAGAPASLRIVSGDGQSGLAGGALAQPLLVQVQDALGNGVPGAALTLSADTAGGSVNPSSATTDSTGTARGIATLSPAAGENRFTARASGVPGSALLRATGVAGGGARLGLVGLPAAVVSGEPHLLTVTAYDAQGNLAQGYSGPVRFTSSDARAVLPENATLTAGSGQVTVRLGTAGAQTLTLTDGSASALSGVTLVVTVGAGAASRLSVDGGSGQSGAASTVLTQPLRVRVADAQGNAVAAHEVTFSAPGGGAISPTTTRTDSLGQALAYATLGSAAGSYTFQARALSATGTPLSGSPASVAATASAGATARLVLSGLPAEATAGDVITATVTAYDAQGNLALGYADTVRFTSTDLRATLPADGASLPGGTATFVLRLCTTGLQSLAVTGSAASAAQGLGVVRVRAGAARSLVALSGDGQSGVAGGPLPLPLRARVVDAEGNGVADTLVSIVPGGDALASPATARSGSDGAAESFAVLGHTAGAYSFELRASDPSGTPLTGSPLHYSATATAGGGARLGLSGVPASLVAGTPFTAVLTAYDGAGNVAAGFNGDVLVSSDDPRAELTAAVTLTSGRAELSARLLSVGAHRFAATDPTGSLAPASAGVLVTTGPAAELLPVSGDSQRGAAGSALREPLRLRVVDAFGNPVAGATVAFAAPAGAMIAPSSARSDVLGYAEAYATLPRGAGGLVFTASSLDTNEEPLLGSPLAFNATSVAGDAVRLALSGAPQSVVAGEAFAVTVTAYDGAGNVAATFASPVRFTASDAAAELPGGRVLDAGTATFTVRLRTAGAQSLTALDGAGALPPSTSGLFVRPGAATTLTLAGGDGQSGAPATLLPQPLRVRVADAFGNGVSGVTVAFTPPGDDGSVSPASVLSDAQGTAQTYATLGRGAGPHEYTASAGGEVTLGGSPVRFRATVTGGGVVRFGVSGLPADLVAGTSATVRLRALDQSANLVPSFTGTALVSSSDARAVFPATLTFTAGLATFQAELRTAGLQSLQVASVQDTSISGATTTTVRAAAPARLTASPLETRLTAGSAATVTLQLVDAFLNPVPARAPLSVSVSGDARIIAGELEGVSGTGSEHVAGTTDARGQASVVIRDLLAEVVSLQATSGTLTPALAVVRFQPGGVARLVLRPSGDATPRACDCNTIVLVAEDAYGNLVRAELPGVRVSVDGEARVAWTDLSEPTGQGSAEVRGGLHADGAASLRVCDGRAERITVRATQSQLAGAAAELVLPFEPGPLDAGRSPPFFDLPAVSARGGVAHVTVTPRDACGNPLGRGLDVTFAHSGPGTLGTVSDAGDGNYTATLSFDGCPPTDLDATVTAAVGEVRLGGAATVLVTCAPVSAERTTVTLPLRELTVCPAGGTLTAQVTPRDDQGALLGPTATVTGASPDVAVVSAAYAGDGRFTVVLAARVCGDAALPLALAVNGVPVTPATLTARFACPVVDAAASSLLGTPTTLVADGVDTATITVTLRDTCGALMRGQSVHLELTRGRLAQADGATDSSGVFSTTLTSTVVSNDTLIASAGPTSLPALHLSYLPPPVAVELAGGGGCSSTPSAPTSPTEPWTLLVLALAFILLLFRTRRPGA